MLFVENLSKNYGKRVAVDNISFKLCGSEVLGILGENGAGKTTLLNVLSGFLSPNNGNIIIDGIDIVKRPLEAKGLIGYMPDSAPLYPEMTVKEYLEYCIALSKVVKKDRKRHFEDIVNALKISEIVPRKCANLSHGLRQRINLAQALVGNPSLILMDEPTNGLDPTQIMEFCSILSLLAKKHTIILSSHTLSFVESSCDRVMIMRNGKSILDRQIKNKDGGTFYTIELMDVNDPKDRLSSLTSVKKLINSSKSENVFSFKLEVNDNTSFIKELNRLTSVSSANICTLKKDSLKIEELYLSAIGKD